jgi:hypothetical protein
MRIFIALKIPSHQPRLNSQTFGLNRRTLTITLLRRRPIQLQSYCWLIYIAKISKDFSLVTDEKTVEVSWSLFAGSVECVRAPDATCRVSGAQAPRTIYLGTKCMRDVSITLRPLIPRKEHGFPRDGILGWSHDNWGRFLQRVGLETSTSWQVNVRSLDTGIKPVEIPTGI